MKRYSESNRARRRTYKPEKVNMKNLPKLTPRGGKHL